MRSQVPRGLAVVGALVALAAGVLVAGVLVACGGGGEAGGTDGRAETAMVETRRLPDPKDLVPRLSDLPSAYVIAETFTKHPTSLFPELVSGYSIDFKNVEMLAMEWPPYLRCEADVFWSSEEARQWFRERRDDVEGWLWWLPSGYLDDEFEEEGVEFKLVSIDERLGDENYAWVMEKGNFAFFGVGWRHDMLLGRCGAPWSVGVELSDPVIEVAKAQQARFADALT